MSTVTSDFLHELEARGYIHQATDPAGLDWYALSDAAAMDNAPQWRP